jgi:hypothetical protein
MLNEVLRKQRNFKRKLRIHFFLAPFKLQYNISYSLSLNLLNTTVWGHLYIISVIPYVLDFRNRQFESDCQ